MTPLLLTIALLTSATLDDGRALAPTAVDERASSRAESSSSSSSSPSSSADAARADREPAPRKRAPPTTSDDAFADLDPFTKCAFTEAYAGLTCLAGVALIAFGVVTLGVSPVFASTPLPIGICGIALGAVALGQALFFAVGAPITLVVELVEGPPPEPSVDPPVAMVY